MNSWNQFLVGGVTIALETVLLQRVGLRRVFFQSRPVGSSGIFAEIQPNKTRL
jgi:hypothetical protein